jgi:hypothetical protein
MHPRIVTLVFVLLLLGMQQHAHEHELTHFGVQFHRSHEQALQLPADDSACALCALYAGGSAALSTGDVPPDESAVSFFVPEGAELSAALSPPAFYLSRAPPSLH